MPLLKNNTILSRSTLKQITAGDLSLPKNELFELPERVLQFGTGVLLRGLPDYFIHKANSQGIFNGRVVVVKSTDSGELNAFHQQDCLFTLCIRGTLNDKQVSENIICSSISRVLTAKGDWHKILECARNPEMKIVISNTTEIGIQLVLEDIRLQPPISFPGKLLAFLFERYKIFNGSPQAGMIIVPTELIVNNGETLATIILKLAYFNELGEHFILWLKTYNHFCNSLVDRIVSGRPSDERYEQFKQQLGYEDILLSVAEPYSMWAIQGNEYVKELLSFSKADKNIIIKEDINIYRELKLRLLNGTHTLAAGLALLSGFSTVAESMEHPVFSSFVRDMMMQELVHGLPKDIAEKDAPDFGLKVLDRFRNTNIEHRWTGIAMQYTSKMKVRNIPTLLRYYELFKKIPENFSWGFAGYLLFMKPVKLENQKYYGKFNEDYYLISDEKAAYFYNIWKNNLLSNVISNIINDKELWGTDLSKIEGFEATIQEKVKLLCHSKLTSIL